MNLKSSIGKLSAVLLIAFTLVGGSGCSQSTDATKLKAPEGIDWEAIESQGEEMNELQSEGE